MGWVVLMIFLYHEKQVEQYKEQEVETQRKRSEVCMVFKEDKEYIIACNHKTKDGKYVGNIDYYFKRSALPIPIMGRPVKFFLLDRETGIKYDYPSIHAAQADAARLPYYSTQFVLENDQIPPQVKSGELTPKQWATTEIKPPWQCCVMAN